MSTNFLSAFDTAPYPCYWLNKAQDIFWQNAAAQGTGLSPETTALVRKLLAETASAEQIASGEILPFPNDALQGKGLALLPLEDGLMAATVQRQGLRVPLLSTHIRDSLTDIFAVLPLLAKKLEDEDIRYLETLQNRSYQLLRISNNLEALARTQGKNTTAYTTDLSALVVSLAEGVRSVCNKENIPLTLDVLPLPLPVRGSSNLLADAILNILRNSIQYTRDGNHIHIRLHTTGGRAILTIQDHGLGIRPGYMGQIFEPFFSADPYGDSSETPGVGLGLPVAWQILHSLGGTIVADSEFGEGTRITLSLPVAGNGEPMMTSLPADYLLNRYSPLYIQLCGYCRYPDL